MKNTVKQPETEEKAPRFSLSLLSDRQIGGHVMDEEDLERRFVVEMLIDGYPAALGRADRFDAALARQGFGDGCYGFGFYLDPSALQAAHMIEVRLANGDKALGPPLMLQAVSIPVVALMRGGGARWLGGLRINGWLGAADGESRIRALVDGQIVAETFASHWTHIGDGRDAMAVRVFDLYLPLRFADGRAHFAQIFDESGRELPGSPCAFVAFDDGLARFLEGRAEIESEKLRVEMFDLLLPQSLPFSMFAQWREKFGREIFSQASLEEKKTRCRKLAWP